MGAEKGGDTWTHPEITTLGGNYEIGKRTRATVLRCAGLADAANKKWIRRFYYVSLREAYEGEKGREGNLTEGG